MIDLKVIETEIFEDAIDEVVCKIMKHSGPDGHIDGHEELTEFIVELLKGQGNEWYEKYKKKLIDMAIDGTEFSSERFHELCMKMEETVSK